MDFLKKGIEDIASRGAGHLKVVGSTIQHAKEQARGHVLQAQEHLIEQAAVAKQRLVENVPAQWQKNIPAKWRGSSAEEPVGDFLSPGGHFVIEIIMSRDVPRADMFSPSDPMVRGHVSIANPDWRGIG